MSNASSLAYAKYGCRPDEIRFEMDGWALIPSWNGDGALECVHSCHKGDMMGMLGWSHAIEGSTKCPGCGAKMPDEVQGLWQLGNMDHMNRVNYRAISQMFDRWARKQFRERCLDAGFLKGDGHEE
jgi:hypothetical protein